MEIFLDEEKYVAHEQGGGRTFVSKETPVCESFVGGTKNLSNDTW